MILTFLFLLVLYGIGIFSFTPSFSITLIFQNYQLSLSVFTFIALILTVIWMCALVLLPFKWIHLFSKWRQKSKEQQKQNYLSQVLEALVNHNKEQYPLLVKQIHSHFTSNEAIYWLILALLQPTEEVFQKLLTFPGTVLGGIYGFLKQAEGMGNITEMRNLLDSLPEKEKNVLWVKQAYLQLAYMESDWTQALSLLESLKRTFSKSEYIRQKACCLLMMEQVEKAYKLDSTQAPIILAYAKETPEKAIKILKRAWETTPCWEIYLSFKKSLLDKTDDEKIKKTVTLVKSNRSNRFSILALADMNMTIQNYPKAKELLEEYLENHPLTQQTALMMATCEREGWNHEEVALKWERKALNLQERTGWICTHCGHTSNKWEAICPTCQLFNSITPN